MKLEMWMTLFFTNGWKLWAYYHEVWAEYCFTIHPCDNNMSSHLNTSTQAMMLIPLTERFTCDIGLHSACQESCLLLDNGDFVLGALPTFLCVSTFGKSKILEGQHH